MSTPRGGLAGSAALMFTGTAVSRVLGLVRNAVLALAITVNVAGVANAFSVANKLPNIIYMLVAGGVLNAVLVPQVVRAMRREDGGREYVDRLLTMAGTALALLTVVLTAGASLLVGLYGSQLGEWFDVSVAFAYWCIPQLFFYGLYTLLGQVLNARSSFGPYMWAPALNNVIAIAGLLVFIAVYGTAATSGGGDPATWTPGRVALLAGTATLGVIAQALVLIVPLWRSGFRWRPRWGLRGTGLGRASRVAGWAFAALAVGQLGYVVVSNVSAAAATAGGGAPDVAGNAAYDNAFLIYMLPQSLITVSLVTALFTRMSHNAAAEDLDKVRADLSLGLRVVGVFTVFATAALAVLALPVARVVLPTVTLPEAQSVAVVTVAMLLGLAALGAWTLVQRVYYAFEDARTLFWVGIPMALIVAGGALLGAALLEPRWWVAGAGLAMSLSTIVGTLVALRRLRGRLHSIDGRRVVRTYLLLLAAAVPAALVGWGLLSLLGLGPGDDARMVAVLVGSLVRVVLVGAVMLAIYLFLLSRFHVGELDVLRRPVLRGLRAIMRRVRTMTGRRSGGSTAVSSTTLGATTSGAGPAEAGQPVHPEDPTPGTVLGGRYVLVDPLTTDLPDASRWRGHDRVLDREVEALVVRGGAALEALDAARRTALVEDPRLLRILGVGEQERGVFVVTEVSAGTSLAEALTDGPLPADQARAIVGEAASALESARRRGVHHLALRPGVVRVTPEGRVLVTGLGTDAAVHGTDGGDYWAASRADAVGLVRLLHAALGGTAAGLPQDVPADLADLCASTLSGDDAGPRSPEELIRLLAPWPDVAWPPARPTAKTANPGDGDGEGPDGPARTSVLALVRDRARGLRAGVANAEESEAPARDEPVEMTFDEIVAAAAPPPPPPPPPASASPSTQSWGVPAAAEVDDADRPAFGDLLAAGTTGAGMPRHVRSAPRPEHPPWHARATGRVAGAAVAGRAVANRAVAVGKDVVGRVSAAARPGIAEELGVDGEPRPQGRAVFDPTPYVLALMLALVVFGLIAAVNNLFGARTARTGERPETERTPVVETTEAAPDALGPGLVITLPTVT